MSALELCRMAARGQEDGHDRNWYTLFTKSARVLAMMHGAADGVSNSKS